MKFAKWALIFGLAVWAIPFAVAMLIFPLRSTERPLFESIMPVAVVMCTVVLGVLYLRKVKQNFLKEGIRLGIVFLSISLIIDLLIFSQGPMAMTLADYLKDIGLTYLVMPIITIGLGYLAGRYPPPPEHKKKKR